MKRVRESSEETAPLPKRVPHCVAWNSWSLNKASPFYTLLAGQARVQVEINDLDDGCLLHIFKQLNPLPDLFHVAATCRVSIARVSYCTMSNVY